VCLCRRR